MSIQFQSLFTIQLLHDFYDKHELRCSDFNIVPSADCAELIKNQQILHKNHNNRLLTVVYASKEENDTPPPEFKFSPFLDFRNGMVFRFYMFLNNPNFDSITALAMNMSQRKRCYFSNVSKNASVAPLSLSAPVHSHALNKLYQSGDLVKGSDNNIYESVRQSDGTIASKDLTSADYWQRTPATNPYVSGADQVVLAGNSYAYKLETPSSNVIAKLFAMNTTDDNLPFDNLVMTIEKTYSQTQQTVTLDLSKLKVGKYRMVVNSEDDVWLYVDADAIKQNVWGVIEIHHFEKVPLAFKLLSSLDNIKVPEPLFTIWFRNRSVIWNYISQNGDIEITDSDASPVSFTPASGLAVRSARSVELKESARKTLTATKTLGGKQIKNLKNPEPGKLVFTKEGSTGYYISNMYVRIDT